MPYVGRAPSAVPVTADDIPANSIDASKIVDGSIELAEIADNSITDAKLNSSKLDGIEASATADQTGSEIKTAYEGESDTNAYTDTEKTKLSGVATSANNYTHPATHSTSEIADTAITAAKLATTLNLQNNDIRVRSLSQWTDSGAIHTSHLCTGSFYSVPGAIVIHTNIDSPWGSSNANMLSIRLQGFSYTHTESPIDIIFGVYSGENNWYQKAYTSNNHPSNWGTDISFGEDSNGKLVVILGTTGTTQRCEVAVTDFIHGFQNVSENVGEGWTMTAETDLSGYSNVSKMNRTGTQGQVFQQSIGVKNSPASYSGTGQTYSGLGATITVQSAMSHITINCATRAQMLGGIDSGNEVSIRCSTDSYASNLSGAVMISNWSGWDQSADSLVFMHDHGQGVGTSITYRLYFGDSRFGGSTYINDQWGYGTDNQATILLTEVSK